MMHWVSAQDQAPPENRVIMVTSGVMWDYKDHYLEHHRYTGRTWNLRGSVYLVIRDGANWVMADGSAIFTPEIKFWADYDNPIRDNTPFTQMDAPQGAMHERWDGRYDRATLEREIKAAQREYDKSSNWREINPNLPPDVKARVERNHADPYHVGAMEKLLAASLAKLEALIALREVSQYPDNHLSGHPFDE